MKVKRVVLVMDEKDHETMKKDKGTTTWETYLVMPKLEEIKKKVKMGKKTEPKEPTPQ